MNVRIGKNKYSGGDNKYDRNNSNHLVMEIDDKSSISDSLSFSALYDKIQNLNGDVDLFVHFNTSIINSKPANKIEYTAKIRHMIDYISNNPMVDNLNIFVLSFDQAFAYDKIHEILYSESVDYRTHTVSFILWRSKLRKLIGSELSRRISNIRSLLG